MQSFKEYFYQTFLESDMNRYIIDNNFGKETVGDFIERHALSIDGNYIILYHATPKTTKFENNVIRAWSKFARSADKAIHFAARDRDLPESKIKLFEVKILPSKLEWTGHYQNNMDIPLTAERVKKIS
jgi:hypothetical protein